MLNVQVQNDYKTSEEKEKNLLSSIKSGILDVSSNGTKKLDIYKLINSPDGRNKLKNILGEKSILSE